MVFVKVRETYDLHTTKSKMTVISIHTPKPDIIKRNYPGLLMQCRAYRPVSADVRVACASMMPLDPQGVGTAEGDVAPEDVFNPILYKATSNKGMSQIEARIAAMNTITPLDVQGPSVDADVTGFVNTADDFDIYYGLLSNTHDWKHANPQSGLSMSNLRPLVYEMVYNVGDAVDHDVAGFDAPGSGGEKFRAAYQSIVGNAKEFPFLNTTSYSRDSSASDGGIAAPGFPVADVGASSAMINVPYVNVVCGAIIIPPSRLHELFYRMVVEWTIEFSKIRPFSEIVTLPSLAVIGAATHFQNYSYESTKKVLTGTDETILDKDSCMVSANVDIDKVM